MSPRTRTIMSARLPLNIVEWGDPAAPPLILQHGGRDHARSWDAVAAAFADDHHVIVPDLRGHGDSGWANDGHYVLMDMVADFHDIIRALDLPPCAIVGHSLGGNIVTRFAGLYPDRVTRLVNIEGLGDAPSVVAEQLARDPIAQWRSWFDRRPEALARTPRRYPDLATLAARMEKVDHRLAPGQAEHLARYAARDNPDGTVSVKYDPALSLFSVLDIGDATKRRLWEQIACPVLLVYGAQSWASDPVADGRAAHFRDVRLEMFEDAGHWVHHDRLGDFIAVVRDFLEA